MQMKKQYKKPAVVLEQYTPQDCLCSCLIVNKNVAEYAQCGYPLEGLDYRVFAQSWTDCQGDGTQLNYCYQIGMNNIFSS